MLSAVGNMPVNSAERFPVTSQVPSWRHTQQGRNVSAFTTHQRPPRPVSFPVTQRTARPRTLGPGWRVGLSHRLRVGGASRSRSHVEMRAWPLSSFYQRHPGPPLPPETVVLPLHEPPQQPWEETPLPRIWARPPGRQSGPTLGRLWSQCFWRTDSRRFFSASVLPCVKGPAWTT